MYACNWEVQFGKSALINSLLGYKEKMLREDITPGNCYSRGKLFTQIWKNR